MAKAIYGNIDMIEEVIIVDDCSHENESVIVEKFAANEGWHYVRNDKNVGASSSRNRGIRLSTADYVAFIDADDVWITGRLKTIGRLLSETKADAYINSFSSFDIKSLQRNSKLTVLSSWHVLLKNRLQPSCFCMKRSVNLRFDESMRYCEDYDLLLRLITHHVVIYDTFEWTILNRQQGTAGGLSANLWQMRLGEIKAYTKFCIRRKHFTVLLPALILFSLMKLIVKVIKLNNKN